MHTTAHIEVEHWNGPHTSRERMECPSLEILRESLSRLDGDKVDSVSIEVDGVGALTIGGGPDQFIVVSFPVDGSSSHVEHDSHRAGSVELQVGGQTGIYPATMVLSSDLAFAIAERFLDDGEFDSSLRWAQDCPPE